jgi:hypothetical protein
MSHLRRTPSLEGANTLRVYVNIDLERCNSQSVLSADEAQVAPIKNPL